MKGAIQAEAEKENCPERSQMFQLCLGGAAKKLVAQIVEEKRQERGGSRDKRPDKCHNQKRDCPWARELPRE
jgi:hypothetical protein